MELFIVVVRVSAEVWPPVCSSAALPPGVEQLEHEDELDELDDSDSILE